MALSSEDIPVLDDATETQPRTEGKSAAQSGQSHPRIRRRNRMITSCLECRRRKLKCDKLHPCTNCSKYARDCMFLAPALDSVSQMKLTEIKEKMGSLERVLEHDVARRSQTKPKKSTDHRKSSVDLPGQTDTSSDEGAMPDDEKDLEPTPLAAVDAAYEDDTNDDMLDLGVKIGKFRMTERLGGYFRPKMTEELTFTLSDPSNDRRTTEERTAVQPMSPDSAEGFLEPGPTYIAPGSGFIFGDVGGRKSLMDFLPSKAAADILTEQYLRNVHSIAKVVHWPSFQVQYDNFWTNVLAGIEPTASLQAIVFAVMFSAIASLSEADVVASFARPKRTVLTNFQTGTEMALGKAQFLRTTKLETLQALVIYLIPMCRNEMSRAHSVLVGTAIRLAECVGLHRDPELIYGLSPVECQVRRTLWFQLCFLDFRTAESQGPRPGIRRDDYDTRFPLNINDEDLMFADPKETETVWTDMTLTRIRMECNEMHRVIWHDRLRLEKKQISITHVLGKIESFRKAMEAKYHPILDIREPLQMHARLAMGILNLRMHIMVLHRYHNSVTARIPDRLRQIILTSGTEQLENAVKIDTLPELAPWRWYSGAYQQWATAFLLLVEIYTYPMRREADRIWDIVDYVFEPDRSLSRAQKARLILGDVRDRTAIYRDIRKVRAPISMTRRLYTRPPRRVGDNSDPFAPMNSSQTYSSTLRNSAAEENKTPDTHSTSPGSHPGESPSPYQSTDATTHSWSFDTPATLLFHQSYSKDQQPRIAGQKQRQYGDPANVPNFLGGISSPSDTGTNDSWPPFISNQQQSWNMMGAGEQNLQQAQPISVCATTSGVAGMSLVVADVPMSSDFAVQMPSGNAPQGDAMALDIDWNEWDAIFPPHLNTGVLNME